MNAQSSLFVIGASLWLFGCHASPADRLPDAADTDTADPVDTPTVEDTGTTTASDDPTDATETASASDTGSPPQDPLVFRVVNATAGPIYLDYIDPVGFTRDPEDEAVRFHQPWCTRTCDEVTGDDCCIDCAYLAAVYLIEAGTIRDFPWDGLVWLPDTELCPSGCPCYRQAPPEPGGYRARVLAAQEIVCWSEPCEPDADGVIWEAGLPDAAIPAATAFELPHAGAIVEITVGD